jgi:hypothetical protein
MLLRRRSPRAAVVVLAVVAILTGCMPAPAPTPSPTPAFASDEEAFAAAEEVYRAYNDAVNAQRAGDESAHPTRFLTGAALEDSLATKRDLLNEGLALRGDGEVSAFAGTDANLTSGSVTMTVCLDVSRTQVVDSFGVDVTPVDRTTRARLEIAFLKVHSDLRISDSYISEEHQC